MENKCFLCGSTNAEFLFESFNVHGRHLWNGHEIFKILRCLECKSVFVGGVEINDQYYKKYYPLDYYKNSYKNEKLANLALNLLGSYSLKKKQKLISKNSQRKKKKLQILDIGCGEGSFLNKINPAKFEKYGVEINKAGYELCRIKGLNVFNDKLENIDFKGTKFDVITLWHVLEHLEKPMELFDKVHQVLKEDGVLIFTTPNTDSLGFKWGKASWFHLDSPRHLILYNQKSIRWLLEQSGFKIIGVENEFYDFPLDLFWSIRKSIARFFIYPLYPLFKFFSREHLTFICKKI